MFSWAVNALTRSPNIWHVNKREFFEINFHASDQWMWWRVCDAELNSAYARLPSGLSRQLLKQDFLDIYLTTFSQSVTSKVQNPWGSFFYSRILKFNLDFKNDAENSEKVFSFSDNCIWICILNLSRLRRGYFLSVANVLTRSPKIWHVNKRELFEHNFSVSGQWIW